MLPCIAAAAAALVSGLHCFALQLMIIYMNYLSPILVLCGAVQLQRALAWLGTFLELDEVECIVANLIYRSIFSFLCVSAVIAKSNIVKMCGRCQGRSSFALLVVKPTTYLTCIDQR